MSGGRVTRHWVELDPASSDAVTAEYVPYDATVSIKTKIESIEGHGFGEANDGENLGTGRELYAGKDGVHLKFKSLLAGDNITLIPSGESVTISSTDTGEANDGVNLGTGHYVYSDKLGVSLRFKSFSAGSNVNIASDSNGITISVPTIGDITTASNTGAGARIWKEKTGADLRFRSIIAGTNVSVTEGTDTVTISSVAADTRVREIEYFTLTGTNLTNRYVMLTYDALDIEIDLTTLGGPSQEYTKDFILVTEGSVTKKISWSPAYCTIGMVDILTTGDILKIEYNRRI
jgi:hypothetical protein